MQGPDGFTAGLAAYGATPSIANQHVIYVVEIVEGRFAGELVETAISLDELARWPLVPPHWIYLRDTVKFPATHTQGCAMPGWLGHSHQVTGWGHDVNPVAGWVAHVRGVIGEAT